MAIAFVRNDQKFRSDHAVLLLPPLAGTIYRLADRQAVS
jgi:hypothetical protein